MSWFFPRQLKTSMGDWIIECNISCDPRWASVLVNEWVSLWDHYRVWGLCLHHSCKFFSCLRKPEPAESLVTFLQSKVLISSQILTNSIKAAELRKTAKSASYLTTQSRLLSPLQWSSHSIFSTEPRVPLSFLKLNPPQYISTVWVFPWLSAASTPTKYLLTGWEFLCIFQSSPTECLDHVWVCP